jgi:opacity protein-like surface antigen
MWTTAVLTWVAFSGVAQAQTGHAGTSAVPAGDTAYVEGVAQSAFGNVTSQSYGVEAGLTVWAPLQVYVEAGRTLDVAPASLGATAQLVAGVLAQEQSGAVGYSAKEPSTFATAGLRFPLTSGTKVQPYVLGGAGLARLTKNVNFTVAGTDVTSNLAQYGVVLGSDLSGTTNNLLTTLGAGVTYAVTPSLVIDFQYRYGHVFSPDQGLNLNRAGLGLGVRF